MDPRTRQHLEIAERNRRIARHIIGSGSGDQPPVYEWASVLAFYSAVHLVNAYCWEKHRFDPGNHKNRSLEVSRHFGHMVAVSYRQLSNSGFHARYTPSFWISAADAQDLLDTDLEAVRRAVLSALGALP